MPFPPLLFLRIAWAALTGRRRSFRGDALEAMRSLKPSPVILGGEHIPMQGPCLVTANHYWHPDFRAWWLALIISASVPLEMHWIVTSGWRSPGLLGPLSRWAFPRGAAVWGFTSMPPIPPAPEEVEARARAVRHALEYARHAPAPVIGLVPEGHDLPGGVLGEPPSGVGRFIWLLSQYCTAIIPVGVCFEAGASQPAPLEVRFGPAYSLRLPPGLSSDERDTLVSEQVMRAIAPLLPPELRGPYI
jgi:hypothetical protein